MVTTRIEQPGFLQEKTGSCGLTVTGEDNEEGALDVSIYIIGEPKKVAQLVGYLLYQVEEEQGENFLAYCLSIYARIAKKPIINNEDGIGHVYVRSDGARQKEAEKLLETIEGIQGL